jgi:hypothetical protein
MMLQEPMGWANNSFENLQLQGTRENLSSRHSLTLKYSAFVTFADMNERGKEIEMEIGS